MEPILLAAMIAITAVSYVLSPKVRTVEGFFHGTSETLEPPGLWTLVLSQVTTWIFARSLLNAGVLGYFFGIAGVLAYAAYYLSFFVGAWIVDALRFRHGHDSVQAYLAGQFGRVGPHCYNFVVGLRLISEIFANLLVIGIVFGPRGSEAYMLTIGAIALLTLGYSMLGGLRASLRTDVFQASVLIAVLAVLLAQAALAQGFSLPAIIASSPDIESPGWVLLVVAFMQIWSYPLHDPVMMDRGFLTDRRTTRLSFYHAGWLSLMLIIAFGLVGVYAGLGKLDGEALMGTLSRLLGSGALILVNVALFLSAVSTLDSTLSSAAKLSVVNMRIAQPTLVNGRWSMVIFMALGLAMLLVGSDDLFAAVAVSGTASVFLAPVVILCIWGGWRVRPGAYAAAFVAAMIAAATYFLESSGYTGIVGSLTGLEHKYTKLLALTLAALAIGFIAFALGRQREVAGHELRAADGGGHG